MLMSKSQLHPVTNAAAAGGNKMATCGSNEGYNRIDSRLNNWEAHKNENNIRGSDHVCVEDSILCGMVEDGSGWDQAVRHMVDTK